MVFHKLSYHFKRSQIYEWYLVMHKELPYYK